MSDSFNSDDRPNRSSLQVTVRYIGDSKEDREKSLEKALSQFKKLVMKEGLMNELKERQYYESDGRKKYLQRQKFYYRLDQKKRKEAHTYKKQGGYDDKKPFHNNTNTGRPNYARPNQPKRPYVPNNNPRPQASHPAVHR